MRPIEFRFWDKANKKMVDAGFLPFIQVGKGAEAYITLAFIDQRFEVMQFTGLIDENGRKVFEGDLMELMVANEFGSSSKELGKVVFFQPTCQFVVERISDTHWKSPILGGHVVGDVYRNPELLPEIKKQ